MRASAAVSIDDDLASRQARIALRSADFESARRIDVKFRIFVQKFRGNHLVYHILLDVRAKLLLRDHFIVLGRNHHRVHAHRALIVVFHRHLCLSVRPQIGQKTALSHPREAHREFMREQNGQRHQFLRFAAGIPEHHSLISRAQRVLFAARSLRLLFDRGVDAHRNIGRLLVDRYDDLASVVRKRAEIIADALDDCPCRFFVIHFRRRGHFAHDEELIVRRAAFYRRTRHRVLRQNRVENPVRNLIADLIGMPLRDAFAGKKLFHVKNPLFNIVSLRAAGICPQIFSAETNLSLRRFYILYSLPALLSTYSYAALRFMPHCACKFSAPVL